MTDLILSKASPHIHLTEFFSDAFSPILLKCLSHTSTTSGSNSYQSINPKFCEIHSLATPPSPPPIIAAFSFFEFNFNPEFTNSSQLLSVVEDAGYSARRLKGDDDFAEV